MLRFCLHNSSRDNWAGGGGVTSRGGGVTSQGNSSASDDDPDNEGDFVLLRAPSAGLVLSAGLFSLVIISH